MPWEEALKPFAACRYRSLLNLASENKLTESFLFLPSLEGPVSSYTEGIGWLTEWQNGAPRLG